MKRSAALVLALIVLSAVAFYGCGNAAKLQEYEMSGDAIPSINSVVGERKVTGVQSSIDNGVISKEYTYESTSVFDDVFAYIKVLIEQEGWLITQDYNLNITPGSAQFGTHSKDEGRILLLTISYEDVRYTVKITKMEGTLE